MSDERRRYFRIDETLGVSYQLLSDQEAEGFAVQGGDIDYAANFDNRIQTLLDACKIESPVTAELIDLVNKKLNFIIYQMDLDTDLMQQVAYTLKQVNVSACGMGFHCHERLAIGKKLKLDILLHPEELHVVALATVVACTHHKSDEGNYFLRVNYEKINRHDQELLIQHIVKGQSNLLKRQRLQAE